MVVIRRELTEESILIRSNHSYNWPLLQSGQRGQLQTELFFPSLRDTAVFQQQQFVPFSDGGGGKRGLCNCN